MILIFRNVNYQLVLLFGILIMCVSCDETKFNKPDSRKMKSEAMEKCFFEKMLRDGTMVIRIKKELIQVRLLGYEIPESSVAATQAFLVERLVNISLRCELTSTNFPQSAKIEYFAWEDKSGEVWKDLGTTLVEQGLAKVNTK